MTNLQLAIQHLLSLPEKYPNEWADFLAQQKNPASVDSLATDTETGAKTLNTQKGDSEKDCN
jgi:hypothetical protein